MPELKHGLEPLTAILRQIEAGSLPNVRAREESAFDEIARPFAKSLVLFGAGLLGRITLAGLRRAGLEPLAFADNSPRLWNQLVDGIPVLSPAGAVRRYANSACFVVTIYNGSGVRQQLKTMGCPMVAHFVPLYWKYAGIFIPDSGIGLPHDLAAHAEAIESCYTILADAQSRQELCGQFRWRYWLDSAALPPAEDARDNYFPALATAGDDEVFVDGGAFDGDTVRAFLEHRSGRFGHVFALEPDRSNRARLEFYRDSLPPEVGARMTVLPYAIGNQNRSVTFCGTGSVISQMGEGSDLVECRRLDDIDWRFPPTYIKMDIEGAEPEALEGGARMLRESMPVLAVCVYHRSEHLWQIPAQIHALAPEYRLFLRRYAEDCWEIGCYAGPPQRLNRKNLKGFEGP